MQAVKVGLVWKTFAMALSNKSSRKKPRNRKSKEERRAMVEFFITKYRNTNDGKFPSLSLTQKEVGGSFYTVREIMDEIIQESTHFSASLLPLEAHQTIDKDPSQAEELNIATLSCTKFDGLGQGLDSVGQGSDHETLIKSSEMHSSSDYDEENIEEVDSVYRDMYATNSESHISIEGINESDHKQERSLHSGELTEDLIDEKSINVTRLTTIELEEKKQAKVGGNIPFSSVVDDNTKERVEFTSSTENSDPLFGHHDKLSISQVNGSIIEDEKLVGGQTVSQLVNELSKEKHVTDGSSVTLDQLEGPCIVELSTTHSTSDKESRDEIFVSQINNAILGQSSASNSLIEDKESEGGELDNLLPENSSAMESNQVVPVHLSSTPTALPNGISNGAFVERNEPIVHTEASTPVSLAPDSKAESVYLSPNCKKEHTLLESLISEHSDSTISRTSENDSLPSQLNSPQEDGDFQAVTSHSDEPSSQNLERPVPVLPLESEDRHHSDADASNKALKHNKGRADEGFKARAMSDINANSISTNDRMLQALVPTLPRKELKAAMKQETNPLWVVMKAFLHALIKFWTE